MASSGRKRGLRGPAPDIRAVLVGYVLLGSLIAVSTQAELNQKQVHEEMLGNARAEVDYSQGRYESARFLWESLAAQGNAQAMVSLAQLYTDGASVPPDPVKAFLWLEKAAAQGEPRALLHISRAYRAGRGTRQSTARADDYLRRAAIAGVPEAEYRYANRLLAAGDLGTAKLWFDEAARHNVTGATATLSQLAATETDCRAASALSARNVRLVLEELDGALNARDMAFYLMTLRPQSRITVLTPADTQPQRISVSDYAALWQSTFDIAQRFRAHRFSSCIEETPEGYRVHSEIQQYVVSDEAAQQLTLFEILELEHTPSGLRVGAIDLRAELPESPLLVP